MSFIDVFNAGGPVMFPLLICSLLTLSVVIERLINLRTNRVLDRSVMNHLRGLVEGGRLDKARELCRAQPGIYTNIMLPVLAVAEKSETMAREAIEDSGRHESVKLKRYLVLLGTIASVSPLLGLLGTVLGMINVFNTIAESGAGQANELSSGISQALITTATGLLIAILALVAHNYFRQKAETIINDLERESVRLLRSLFHDTETPVKEPARVAASGE